MRSEQSTIRALKALARDWPDGLWVFSADGALNVMRTGPSGERVMLETGGVDPEYIVDSIKIPSDGGDW